MKHLKQNIYVVSILFFSLISSVALSYVITPTPTNMKETNKTEQPVKAEQINKNFNESLIILLPIKEK